MSNGNNVEKSIENWVDICDLVNDDISTQLTVTITEVMETYEGLLGILEGNFRPTNIVEDYDYKDPEHFKKLTDFLNHSLDEVVDGLADVDWMVTLIKHLDPNIDLTYIYTRLFAKMERWLGMGEGEFNLAESVEVRKQRVLNSNYSKFCTTEEEVERSVKKYQDIGVEVKAIQNLGYYVLKSKASQHGSDGKDYPKNKIVKGILFVDPKSVD